MENDRKKSKCRINNNLVLKDVLSARCNSGRSRRGIRQHVPMLELLAFEVKMKLRFNSYSVEHAQFTFEYCSSRPFAFNCFRTEACRIFPGPPLQKSFWSPMETG